MIQHFFALAVVGSLAIIGTSWFTAINSLLHKPIEYVLFDIVVDNTTEVTKLSNVRAANVPALPITWEFLLVDNKTGEPYCYATGKGTVTNVPDNRWGPYPLQVYMGDADCSRADGQWAVVTARISWDNQYGPTYTEVVSDPFQVRLGMDMDAEARAR